MKKIFSAIMLLTLIIFATPAQAQADFNFERDFDGQIMHYTTGGPARARVMYDIDFLALREGPSVNYPMIAKIPPGTLITVRREYIGGGADLGQQNGFRRVLNYNGLSGWAADRYLIHINDNR